MRKATVKPPSFREAAFAVMERAYLREQRREVLRGRSADHVCGAALGVERPGEVLEESRTSRRRY